MKKPAFLKKGDHIAIVATARKVQSEELEKAIALLKSWGLVPVIGKTIGLEENQFAGSDRERAADFQRQLDDPKIKAIWCARGGYGSVRILDLLDFKNFEQNPKWIIGYSDITALHCHILRLGIAGIHGEMPALIAKKDDQTAESLKNILFGKKPSYSWQSDQKLKRKGKASGLCVGGNLSMLYSLCGSPSALNSEKCILFLEDLDEYLYHIDRMMQNLKRNRWFENLAGLVVGGMSDMNDNTIPFGKTAEEIIYDTVKAYNFPVVFDFPAGHTSTNLALIYGNEVTLEVGEEEHSLKFL